MIVRSVLRFPQYVAHARGPFTSARIFLTVLAAVVALDGPALGAPFPLDPDAGAWSDRFYLGSPDGRVRHMVNVGRELFLIGDFESIGPTRAHRCVRYDGITWSACDLTVVGEIRQALEFGGDLIIAGTFTSVQGRPARYVARFHEGQWEALGGGPPAAVASIEVFQGGLVASCELEAGGFYHFHRWDGHTWARFGNEAYGSIADDLEVFRGQLYALARYPYVGDYRVRYVRRWNGLDWEYISDAESYGSWLPKGYFGLKSANDRLFVMGYSATDLADHAGGELVAWDGSSWHELALPSCNDTEFAEWVSSVLPRGNETWVGGWFPSETGSKNLGLRILRGSTFEDVPGGAIAGDCFHGGGSVALLEEHRGSVYVAGGFSTIGGVASPNLAKWTNSTWSQPAASGLGLVGQVRAITEYNGQIVVGGDLPFAGDAAVRNLATFDGNSWRSLGGGTDGRVDAVYPWHGGLIVGGAFSMAGEVSAHNVAFWDGSQWSPLGSGVNSSWLSSFVELDGNLIACGWIGDSNRENQACARWTGSTWEALNEQRIAFAKSPVVFNDRLFAAGSTRTHVWDGHTWTPAGRPSQTSGYATLHAFRGRLYRVATPYGWNVPTDCLYRWTGADWEPVPDSPTIHESTLTEYAGFLVCFGRVGWSEGGQPGSARLVLYDGFHWWTLPSAINGDALAAVASGSELAVGGGFSFAGGSGSSRFALWHPNRMPVAPRAFDATRTVGKTVVHLGFVDGWEGVSYQILRRASGQVDVRLTSEPLRGGLDFCVVDSAAPSNARYYAELVATQERPFMEFGPLAATGANFSPREFRARRFAGGTEVKWAPPQSPPPKRVTLWRGTGTEVEGVVSLDGDSTVTFFDPDPPLAEFSYWLSATSDLGFECHLPIHVRGAVAGISNLGVQPDPLGVRISWSTTPIGREGLFHVQRRSRGSDWQQLTADPLSNTTSYSFVDPSPPRLGAIYRIEQVMSDGRHVNFSEERSFVAEDWAFAGVSVTPQPASKTLRLSFRIPERSHVTIDVINAGGQRVATLLDATVGPGSIDQSFDLRQGPAGRLPAGVHWVRFVGAGVERHYRLTILR